MSFARLTEEQEERIAARWTRARANWRILRYILALFALAILGVAIYFSGELAGLDYCNRAAGRNPD